jgi:hypothetical protein
MGTAFLLMLSRFNRRGLTGGCTRRRPLKQRADSRMLRAAAAGEPQFG